MTRDRIERHHVSGLIEGSNIPLADLAADPRTRGIDLSSADLNRSGSIEAHEEDDRLAALLDGLDGRRDGWIELARDGRATAARAAVDVIADHRANIPALRMTLDARHVASVERGVVLLGMSETAFAEARALRRETPVWLVTDPRRPGRSPALETRPLIHEAVGTLGLPEAQSLAIEAVIANAPPSGRAELLDLARVWAPAERGQPIPSRLMLSGHGDGDQIFGDDQDSLRVEDIRGLARAMPAAASRIDAIHVGACQHGYQSRVELWRAAFPRLRSVWAYAGFSSSGPAAHVQQAAWERATREPGHGATDVGPELARGTRRGDNVAVWTFDGGYRGPAQRDLAAILTDIDGAERNVARYISGELGVDDPRSGPVWQQYQWLQEVLAHSDFGDQPRELRQWARAEADRFLRLRFFTTTVTRAFDRAYRRPIAHGYRAMGMEPPRFEGMSRREVLAEVARFRRRVESRADAPPAARELVPLLVEGLVELRASRIPTEWV